MGNCQAIDNATLMIQRPGGRVEKMYWPVAASEVMKTNPGHYVALLLTTTTVYSPPSTGTAASTAPVAAAAANAASPAPVRVTRIKLLRPTDTLILGQVYRLISNEEVMKGLWAKKYAKMKKKEIESGEQREMIKEKLGCEFELSSGRIRSNGDPKTDQALKHEERRHHRHNKQRAESSSAAAKSRAWQPSLRSISESTS